ncbi:MULTISPECIES: GNAT family N-acetyltransferase [Metabacillus]|uniref:GNAT family N-acetyltransferase n=1 Tax=Metabacillus hrfriensis TaxID=3048891 RepID=A0ACD4R6J9_9BACI|nr:MULTISPECIES: GNAT family N-acetyltransferase [Metabacillus]UAL50567.1 GNAT family N-acetyltransferase [Metabacillus dongyingensis]USK26831.1 GNAT family N-acetyltransferase [Bacillus sp. CMF21]WHZ56059.1 GNAT family N-acetyltransferase [Metabacillus sp. CT-WN-B3]
MIKKIDITNPKFAEEVLNVQLPSYKVEAEIIDFYEIPPLKDTVETLLQCSETFFGYYISEELCGAISIKVEKDVMDIHRLIVHPNYFKKGIAKMLLDFIESHIEGIETIIVSTGSKNTPAVNFYEKNGFSKIGETRVNERLSLTSFKKKI